MTGETMINNIGTTFAVSFNVEIVGVSGSTGITLISCSKTNDTATIDVNAGNTITIFASVVPEVSGTTYTFLWTSKPDCFGNTFNVSSVSFQITGICKLPIQVGTELIISGQKLTCFLIFRTKTLAAISIDVSVDGQTMYNPTCCGTICVTQNANVILTVASDVETPNYQWYICNTPIGQTGQIYQPDTSVIGNISYSVIVSPTNSQNVLFCNITISTLPPINPQIEAIINCNSSQILTCGSTLYVCQDDVLSLSILPTPGCITNYIYVWNLSDTLIATTQSIIVCTNVPNVYNYNVFQINCCNIEITSYCSITLIVSPKVTIVPIKNDIIIPFTCGKSIKIKQCDELYLLAQTNDKVVWTKDKKIISTSPLIKIKTKHLGKFVYSVRISSNGQKHKECSSCSICSTTIKIKK